MLNRYSHPDLPAPVAEDDCPLPHAPGMDGDGPELLVEPGRVVPELPQLGVPHPGGEHHVKEDLEAR